MSLDLMGLLRLKISNELRDEGEALYRAYSADSHALKVGKCQGFDLVLEMIDNLEREDDDRRNAL